LAKNFVQFRIIMKQTSTKICLNPERKTR
jgi:hypothetical protein